MRAASLVTLALVLALTSASHAQPSQAFDDWLQDLLTEARTLGYSDELLTETLVGVTPLHRVIASDRRQPEVTLTFDEYLRRRVTPAVVQRGRELASEHRDILASVRAAYGVPPKVILAIWGLETRFGRFSGDVPVFQALATLAWEPRRATFFRAQLYDALTMVGRRHIDAASMKGSWAGAMGQPQFMPSSYLAYAVDFDGDSRRDIWTSPADTFASIANYLVSHGWQGDDPWGREVRVAPAAAERASRALGVRKSGCRAMRDMIGPAPLAAWQRLGVRRADGTSLPTGSSAANLVRVGKQRFLVHGNYDALLRYNCANYYALSVAILADRIGGGIIDAAPRSPGSAPGAAYHSGPADAGAGARFDADRAPLRGSPSGSGGSRGAASAVHAVASPPSSRPRASRRSRARSTTPVEPRSYVRPPSPRTCPPSWRPVSGFDHSRGTIHTRPRT